MGAKESGQPRIVFHGFFTDASGHGDEARGFGRGLAARQPGLRFDDLTGACAGNLDPNDTALWRRRAERAGDTRGISLVHLPGSAAFQRPPGSVYCVGRAMYETDRLPSGWELAANQMDELWVPATFNLRSFRASGVTTRIEVVPGGVDLDVFHPDVPPMPLPGRRGTVFLSIFAWGHRKGPDVLLRAWADAFGPSDDVTLVLRTRLPAEDLGAIVASMTGRPLDTMAPIVVLPGRIADADLPSLYAAADVVVLPTRGEGWSRTFSEAMACAKPVIATRWSGHLDFMNDDNSLLVEIDGLVPVVNSSDHPYPGMRWAEPSAASLVDQLIRAASDPVLRARIGAQAKHDMAAWTWDHACDVASQRLDDIWADMRRPSRASRSRTSRSGNSSRAGHRGPGATAGHVAPAWDRGAKLLEQGRAHLVAGRYEVALELCRQAATESVDGATVAAARSVAIEGLLVLGRARDALAEVAGLRRCAGDPVAGRADRYESRARLALGEAEEALACLDRHPGDPTGAGGAVAGPVDPLRIATLAALGRDEEVADMLLAALRRGDDVEEHLPLLVDSLDRCGRALTVMAPAVAPAGRLQFAAQVRRLDPGRADRVLDAWYQHDPSSRPALAAAAAVAPDTALARQLVWSQRLRHHGLSYACPLVKAATDPDRAGPERALAAATATAAFADPRGRLAFAASVLGLPAGERAEVRAQVALLDPALALLVDRLAVAEPGAGPAAVPTGRRVLVVDCDVAGIRGSALALALRRAGHHVTMVEPQPAASVARLLGRYGIAVHGWPDTGVEGWVDSCSDLVTRLYADASFDVAVTTAPARAIAPVLRLLLPRTSVVVDGGERADGPAVAPWAAAGTLLAPRPSVPLAVRSGICVAGDFRRVSARLLQQWATTAVPPLAAKLGDHPCAVVGDDPGRRMAATLPAAVSVGPLGDPTPWLRAARLVIVPFGQGAEHWLAAAAMCGTPALLFPDDTAATVTGPGATATMFADAVAAVLTDDGLWDRFAPTPDVPDIGVVPDPLAAVVVPTLPSAPAPGGVVRWVGDVFSHHSLAHCNRELVRHLSGRDDLPPLTVATSERGSRPADSIADLVGVTIDAGGPRPTATSVEIRHQWPPDLTPVDAGLLVVMQPWEYGGLPVTWVGALRDVVDEMWVPTTWVRDCAVASGVPPWKVAVVPYGVDTGRYRPDGHRWELQTTKRTRLLYVGGCLDRKGFDVLMETYLSTFSAADDVCLVIKPFGSDSVYRHSTMEGRARQAAAEAGAAVEIIDGDLSGDDMAALYRSCDALVHPFRGEGFAMTVAEAMASGLPVVVTAGGAADDFCDDGVGWMIPAERVPLNLEGLAASSPGTWWLEPDRPALRAALLALVADHEGARARGRAGRVRIVDHFTWDHAADVAAARIAALLEANAPAHLEPAVKT